MHIEQVHLLRIVEGCPLYDSTAELDRLQIGNRGHSSSPSHLIVNAQEFGQSLLGLELICHGPTRELGGIAKFFLIWKFIDFHNDAVSGERKVLSFCVPIVYVFLDFLCRIEYTSMFRYREAPACSCIKSLRMSFIWKIFTKHVVERTFETAVSNHTAVDQLQ